MTFQRISIRKSTSKSLLEIPFYIESPGSKCLNNINDSNFCSNRDNHTFQTPQFTEEDLKESDKISKGSKSHMNISDQ